METLLPLVSFIALSSAAMIAFMAWQFNAARGGPNVTGWDLSGALMLIGAAAGMMSEPSHIPLLFGLAPMS